jgi:galactokinase
VIVAEAPGRVNLLGEHTDYNDGFVLPMAIPQRTRVSWRERSDRRVTVRSARVGEASFELGREERTHTFVDYIAGVCVALAEQGMQLGGCDLTIESDVPMGGGLSSSAALMVATLRALRTANRLPVDDLAIARLAHRAETSFVGAPVGMLDQMACSLASETSALFLDTRSMRYEQVPFPGDAELVIIDSGITHDHTTGDYRVRRGECEEAARRLGIPKLRDLRDHDWESLPDLLRRRVRHVVTENQRVLDGVAAMRAGDVAKLGQLFLASHASMRDDYAVSVPEMDRLVDIAANDPDIFGARMTGGGFGGAMVALAKKGRALASGRRIVNAYAKKGRLLVPGEAT